MKGWLYLTAPLQVIGLLVASGAFLGVLWHLYRTAKRSTATKAMMDAIAREP